MVRLAVLLAVLLAAGSIFFFQTRTNTESPMATTAKSEPNVIREVPSGMREYKNINYHFSILYSAGLTVEERNHDGGATTIVFEDRERVQGFQIFVRPYTGGELSEEQFKLDNPSGVREKLQPVTIDGAVGAAFYSQEPNLGPTREVWFVRDGYLYEVTTLKPLEADLQTVLLTWQFIK
jgi:hypothetical protein